MAYHVLVLAGGSGTRLWPMSRAQLPKHLLPLGQGGVSLLRATVERVLPLTSLVHVVTAAEQVDLCEQALRLVPRLGDDVLIAEPQARGTGPALGLAVRTILQNDPDALISSVHSDHYINGDDAYRAAVVAGAGWAQATRGLATVGIKPTFPATGLGYVEIAGPRDGTWTALSDVNADVVAEASACRAFRAAGFAEKPALELAEKYVADGTHLWNLGLFSFSGAQFWQELEASDGQIAEQIDEVLAARQEGNEERAAQVYSGIRNVPVEPLVFEKTQELTVIEAEFGWSDLGTYQDLYQSRISEANRDGNVTAGDWVAIDSHNCLIDGRGGRAVVVAGLDGVAVIDTEVGVLVVPLDKSQKVKDVVEQLRRDNRTDVL